MTKYIVEMKSGEAQSAVVEVEADDETQAVDKAAAIQNDVAPGGAWEVVKVWKK